MTDLTMSQFASKDDLLAAQAAQAVHQIGEPAAPVGKPIKDAIDALVMAAFTEGGCSEHRMSEARIQTELRKKELRTLLSTPQPCCRSHPHEEMTPMCELRTEIARLTNALARAEAAAPQAVQAAVPDDWRDQFSESVYEDLSAACNQDVPLEEYPARILNILDAIVGPRHPTVIKWRNDAIRSCIAIAYKYCSDPESYRYLKQDLEAMLAAPAHPAEGVPAQAVAVADARSARQITDAIVENFKDAGWYVPSVDEALVLEAVSAAIVEHGTTEPLTGVATDVDSMARVLMAAFAKAEPEHPITRYPTSFVSTFADMARAALAATQLADGVPAQSYVADFFRENGFYPSLAQAFAAGVAHAAATQPAAQGMDALTPAARDVLAERKRQIETEGWKPERDDVYDTGEMALAAACYAAHSASCAAIKAPHTARGGFVRTRSAQDFVGEMWPWSADWWKPSGHRRNLEKAAALILAEIERIDRAALAAQAKQGGA